MHLVLNSRQTLLLLLVSALCAAAANLIAQAQEDETLVSSYFRSLLLSESSSDFTAAVEKLNNDYTSKAIALHSEGKFKRCIRTAEQTTEQAPVRERDPLYLIEAECRFRAKEYPYARKALKQVLKLRGSSSDALFLLGQIELLEQDFVAAEQYLHESLWFDRFQIYQRSAALRSYAEALLGQDKRDGAKRALQEASQVKAESAPEGGTPSLLLAATLLDEGEYQQVIRILTSAKIEPGDQSQPEILSNIFLAKAYFESRTAENPQAMLNNALAQLTEVSDAPAPAQHRQALKRLELRVLLHLGELARAQEEYATAQREFPEDPVIASLGSQLALQQAEKEREQSLKETAPL